MNKETNTDKQSVEELAKAYAERVCNGQFPIEYSREQVVKHTADDFKAGWDACMGNVIVEDRNEFIEMADRILKARKSTQPIAQSVEADKTAASEAIAFAEGKWIKMSEALPEYGVDILVFADHGDSDSISVVQWSKQEFKYWQLNNYSHWMPLPKSPIELLQHTGASQGTNKL